MAVVAVPPVAGPPVPARPVVAVGRVAPVVRALVGALGGDGSVTVKDGALLGINVASMLRQIMTLGLDRSATETQRTDFAEAGASWIAGTLEAMDNIQAKQAPRL